MEKEPVLNSLARSGDDTAIIGVVEVAITAVEYSVRFSTRKRSRRRFRVFGTFLLLIYRFILENYEFGDL